MPSSKGTRLQGSHKKKLGFFDLSTEIRYQIYEIFLLDDQPIDIAPVPWKVRLLSRNDTKPTVDKGRYALHIFLICKRIYYEASWIFYSRNTFQLTIRYKPGTFRENIYPTISSVVSEHPFFIQGIVFRPTYPKRQTIDYPWPGATMLRWEYATSTDLISRAKMERQARAGQKLTQIYWPTERYRSFVKRLRIELIFEIGWMRTRPVVDGLMNGAIRAGLRSLFEGILPQADVELHLKLPVSPSPRRQEEGQTITSPSPENKADASLKLILLPLAPLGCAKTLRVTTSGDHQLITSKHCEKLREHLVKYSKRHDLEDRPPWRV